MRDTGPKAEKKTRERLLKKFELINDFVEKVDISAKPDIKNAAHFILRDGSVLTLDEEGTGDYHKLLDELDREFNKKADLSRRSVERFAHDAIFRLLKARSKSTEEFDSERIKAFTELKARLSAEPTPHKCFVPVEGFAIEDLPLSFAGIRFVAFGKSHRRELLRSKSVRANKQFRSQVPGPKDDKRWGQLWGRPHAVVTVEARDSASARVMARSVTADALDTLNFLVDFIPYNYAWVGLLGNASPIHDIVPMLSADGRYTPILQAVGPVGPYRLDTLRTDAFASRLLKILGELSRQAKPETAGELLLTAARWVGRATVVANRERSFLLYMIALESAILPKIRVGLGYQLGRRVAALLGRTRKKRQDIFGEIDHAYDVRSQIVHNGVYEVTEEDLGLIRARTLGVLVLLIRRRKLWNLSAKDFGDWLEQQVFR